MPRRRRTTVEWVPAFVVAALAVGGIVAIFAGGIVAIFAGGRALGQVLVGGAVAGAALTLALTTRRARSRR